MEYTLTIDAIRDILVHPNEERGKSHILQVFDIREFEESNGKRRIKLSDGKLFVRAVVDNGRKAKDYDIVEVQEFRLAKIRGSSILLIEDFNVISKSNELIGDPTDYYLVGSKVKKRKTQKDNYRKKAIRYNQDVKFNKVNKVNEKKSRMHSCFNSLFNHINLQRYDTREFDIEVNK